MDHLIFILKDKNKKREIEQMSAGRLFIRRLEENGLQGGRGVRPQRRGAGGQPNAE